MCSAAEKTEYVTVSFTLGFGNLYKGTWNSGTHSISFKLGISFAYHDIIETSSLERIGIHQQHITTQTIHTILGPI